MSQPIRVGGEFWRCDKCGEEYHASIAHECAGQPPSDEPTETLAQTWPWGVYTTAYGLRIRHEITGTELDLYEAARKLNAYAAERALLAGPPTEEEPPK